jgi:hypothetical protein
MRSLLLTFLVACPILVVSISCRDELELYGVYESKLSKERVRVDFIGKNWQIKDAVNAGALGNRAGFHCESFWSKGQKALVVLTTASGYERNYYNYQRNYWESGCELEREGIMELERFQGEYKKVKD